MEKASITYAKNHLSRLIDRIRRGESFLVTERDVVVAALIPVGACQVAADARLSALARAGLVSPPETALDSKKFLAEARPVLNSGGSIVETVRQDREESA